MTVGELIEVLKTMPQDVQVGLAVADPKDTAYSKADIKVVKSEDGVEIRAFVWSDDENAFAPWQVMND